MYKSSAVLVIIVNEEVIGDTIQCGFFSPCNSKSTPEAQNGSSRHHAGSETVKPSAVSLSFVQAIGSAPRRIQASEPELCSRA